MHCYISPHYSAIWVSRISGNDQRKMPDEGYHVDIQVMFYSMMLLCLIVGSFCTVCHNDQSSLWSSHLVLKYFNRAVTEPLKATGLKASIALSHHIPLTTIGIIKIYHLNMHVEVCWHKPYSFQLRIHINKVCCWFA